MSACLPSPLKVPIPVGQQVSLHGPDECAFLLDRCGGRVYAMNASGAFLWRCLAGAMSPRTAASSLAGAAGLPIEVAEDHVSVILDQWAALGLIGGAPTDEDPRGSSEAPRPARSPVRLRPPPTAAAAERRYALLDTVFLVGFFDHATADAADGVLGAGPIGSARTDCRIDVRDDGGAITIESDGSVLDHCAAIDEIVPTLKARLSHLALERDAPHGVLHAAALAKADGTLLLPAPAGSGKSTLAAGLACGGGWCLIADDLVPLGDGRADVRPFPTPICLKEGAWPLLQRLEPALDELPVFVRQDGRRVRYVRPGTDRNGWSANAVPPVRWIIFPRHGPDVPPRLVRLPRKVCVERLLPQLFSRSGALEPRQLDGVIALAERALCYELEVGGLDQGVALIREVTG